MARRSLFRRYGPLSPEDFKVGDIVEVAFSIVGVPIRGDRTMVMLNMRALTLLDDHVRKVRGHSYLTTKCSM